MVAQIREKKIREEKKAREKKVNKKKSARRLVLKHQNWQNVENFFLNAVKCKQRSEVYRIFMVTIS